MKNVSRRYKSPSNREIIQFKLERLKEFIKEEIEWGIPSYEDESLSPKNGLEEIFKRVIELDNLMNQRIDNINLSTQTIQPPATPEALDEISEAIE